MIDNKSEIKHLFLEIKRGNTSAFDELFLRYYNKLLAFANQYTQQLESAEEITSELFVKIWLRREELTNVLNPEVYLFISVKNACLNLMRSDRKRQLTFTADDGQQVEQVSNHYVRSMEDKELLQILDIAVEALPEQRKLIFRLIKEQGLKPNVVAQILGISRRTVENQLYKAVKTLAESLSGYLGYHPQTKTSKKQVLSNIVTSIFW
jgi:RNA polymerase sigma-70 factor (family 1)